MVRSPFSCADRWPLCHAQQSVVLVGGSIYNSVAVTSGVNTFVAHRQFTRFNPRRVE
jgi:hypothetical protein